MDEKKVDQLIQLLEEMLESKMETNDCGGSTCATPAGCYLPQFSMDQSLARYNDQSATAAANWQLNAVNQQQMLQMQSQAMLGQITGISAPAPRQ